MNAPERPAPLIILTGPPGAGKSTAAEGVAAHFEHSVVVSGDAFFDFLRNGRIAPWNVEAHSQNEAVIRATMRAASAYAEAGVTTVVDGIFGPWFMAEMLQSVDAAVTIDYIVLSAEEATVRARVSGDSTAPEAQLRSDVAAKMLADFETHNDTIAGHTIDTTNITPEEGVAVIREGLGAGRFRLQR